MNGELYFDEEAERAVIGSMLEDNKTIPGCLSILGENAFLRVPHQLIFDAIGELTRKGDAVDAVTVGELLARKGEIGRIGGSVYLYDVVNSTPAAENAEYYAKIVRKKQILRQLVSAGKQIATLPSQNGDDPVALLAQAQQMIMAIDTKTEEQTTIVEQVDAAYRTWMNYSEGNTIDIATGFKNFDILTGGFERKDLTIIGGYPSVGKSAWLHNTLLHIAVKNMLPCCLFTYEDRVENVINRMVSMVTGLNPKWKDDREQAKTPAVLEVFRAIQKSALIIKDKPPRDISELIIAIQRESLAVPEGLAVVAVDNIQLVKDKTAHNSEQEVSNVTGTLKNVAKLTNAAVAAVSHLSREAIKTGRRPILSDLRYSGMAEANADRVIFVHREDYGDYEFPSPISEAEIIVAKGRNNAIGSIPMKFHRGIFKFEEAV